MTRILFLLVTIISAHAEWQVINYNGDVWVSYVSGGVYQEQYCIGGGGCIQDMQDASGSMLAPPGPSLTGGTNHTDRVIQGCAWSLDVLVNGVYGAPDPRYNVNTAGDANDDFSIVYDVIWYQAEGRLDVYAIANHQ